MPITGIFNADFSAFYDAVTQAQIKLVDFDAGADQVSKSLNRVNESLSGKQIMQEAAEITRVLDNMQGIAGLTAREMSAIGPKLSEAVEKARLMGETLPANTAKYADEMKNATGTMDQMRSMATSLAGALGVTFSIGTIVNFGKSLFDAADQMEKLATQTGMTVGEIAKLQEVSRVSSVDLETMSRASQNLQDSLGDTKGIEAINKLGLSFVAVRNASPYDALKMVTEALGGVTDESQKTQLAHDLLKGASKEMAAAMKTDWDSVTANVNTNVDAQIAAVNRLKTATVGIWTNFKNEAITSLGNVALAIEKLKDSPIEFGKMFLEASRKGGDINLVINTIGQMEAHVRSATAAAQTGKLVPEMPKLETLQNLATISGTAWQAGQTGADAAAEATRRAQAEYKKQTEETIKLHEAYVNLNSAGSSWQDTLAAMDQDLVATLTYYTSAGASVDDLKRAFGATEIQIHAVSEAVREQQKVLDDFDKDVIKTRELWIQLGQTQIERTGTATDKMVADIERWFNSEVAKLKESDLNYRAHYTALAAVANEKLGGIMVNWDQLKDKSLASLQDTAARAEATWAEAAAHMDQYSVDTVEALRKQADAAQQAVESWNTVGTAADNAGKTAKGALDAAGAGADQTRGKVDALAGSFHVLTQTAEQWRAQAAGLLADAARIDQTAGASTTGWEWQYSQNLKSAAGRATASAGRQEQLDTAIASLNTNAGAWGGGTYRQGWTVNVNGVVNGDQLANELVSGMRRRGVSPGVA